MPTYQRYSIGIAGLDSRVLVKTDYAIEKILNFYEQNRDEGNSVRDPVELLTNVRDRSFYTITNQNKNLVGVAGCFRYFERHIEAGGTRIIIPGYNFQKILSWCRAINEIYVEAPSDCYFCAIASKNKKSLHNIEKIGFERFIPDSEFMGSIGKDIQEIDMENVVFLRLPFRSENNIISDYAKRILYLLDNPVIDHIDGKDRIALSFDIPIFRKRKLLEGLANNDKAYLDF